MVDEQTEGNGRRLFLASDEKAAEKSTARVAIKLVHPDIASNPGLLDLVCEEIKVVKCVAHPNLLRYFELERNAPGTFIVREWVHGFLLYDLLRLRRSCRPQEVIAVLEPLLATLDFVSERRDWSS